MSGWRDIATPPANGTGVLVYFGKAEWRNMDGETVSFGPLRDYVERVEVGYYDDNTWLESGTGHDMFESWREPEQLPTHWMPLPDAPLPTPQETEE